MKESLLKKEFKNKDIQRVRNIVNNDFTSKTSSGIGYSKTNVERQEGDVWEENGRTWTIKNGIKQNISKLKPFKDLVKIPLTCPKCNQSMNYWLSKKMYKIHGFCFDCTVDYETHLRKIGKYKEYEESMIKGGIQSFTKDLEQWVHDKISESNTFVTEDGDVEDWSKQSKESQEKILNDINDFIKSTKSSLKD